MKGRKRHALVDTQGFLLKVVVTAADVPDRAGGWLLTQALRLFGPTLPRLRHLWADSAYAGDEFANDLKTQYGWELEIVKRAPDQPRDQFVVQSHRWIIERTFAWWSGYRRLAKDYEYQLESSEALIYAAMSHLLVRRLARLTRPTPTRSVPAGPSRTT